MHIGIDGYTLKCESCGKPRTEIEFDLQMVYLWANQFGSKIRLFCHRCGTVHDVTIKPGVEPVIVRHSMKCAIFKTESEKQENRELQNENDYMRDLLRQLGIDDIWGDFSVPRLSVANVMALEKAIASALEV